MTIISCKPVKKYNMNRTHTSNACYTSNKLITYNSNKINPDNYKYIVSVKSGNKTPRCKIPREKVSSGIRFNKIIYEDNDFKKIIYPCELQFTQITEDDAIETNIINIQQSWPHWYKIKVVPFVKNK